VTRGRAILRPQTEDNGMDVAVARRMEREGGRALSRTVAAGAAAYDRTTVLPRLIPVGPDDMGPDTAATARRICLRLARALRQERNRGRSGHWTYDLGRHLGLLQALRAERAALTRLSRAKATTKGRGD
jgi:hypothetical protein